MNSMKTAQNEAETRPNKIRKNIYIEQWVIDYGLNLRDQGYCANFSDALEKLSQFHKNESGKIKLNFKNPDEQREFVEYALAKRKTPSQALADIVSAFLAAKRST